MLFRAKLSVLVKSDKENRLFSRFCDDMPILPAGCKIRPFFLEIESVHYDYERQELIYVLASKRADEILPDFLLQHGFSQELRK